MQEISQGAIEYNKMPARTAVGRSQKSRMHDSIPSLKAVQEAPVKYNNIPSRTAASQKNRANPNDNVSSLKASIANFHKSQDNINVADDSVSSLKATIAAFHESQSKPAQQPRSRSPIPTSINTKHVRFNKHITKHYGLSKKDMPPEEREQYWYTKNDDKKIFMNAKLTVRMIMKGVPFDDVENCARGLECKTQTESKKRVRNKKKAIAALLSEQELQRLQGTKDTDRLARAVRKYTKELADLATEVAVQDEQDVRDYLDDTRNDLQSHLVAPESLASSE